MSDHRARILDLLYDYAHRFDRADFPGFAELFAHGTLDLRGVTAPMTGADAVLAFIEDRVILYDGSPCTNHLIHNPIVEVAPDERTATARSYVQILQGAPHFTLQTIATGRYEDRFERNGTAWGFAERVGTGSLRGDFTHHLRPATRP